MTHWIVPSNNNFFRLDDSLKGRNKIFWRQMSTQRTLMCKLKYRTKTE